jgi:hypothetical protein
MDGKSVLPFQLTARGNPPDDDAVNLLTLGAAQVEVMLFERANDICHETVRF